VRAIANQRRTSTKQASEHREGSIKQRKRSDQNRKKQTGRRRGAGAIEVQGEEGYAKAKHRAPGVIRNYLFRIFEKLGVSTRVELVLYCFGEKQAQLFGARPDGAEGSNGNRRA